MWRTAVCRDSVHQRPSLTLLGGREARQRPSRLALHPEEVSKGGRGVGKADQVQDKHPPVK